MCKRTIEIHDFGPIEHAVVDLNKSFQIYIGAQATGKSTICKMVYFCEKLRDFSLSFLLEETHNLNIDQKPMAGYMNYLKKQFMGCFGKTTHMRFFEICYCFGGHKIRISLKEGFVNFLFSEDLFFAMRALIRDACGMQRQINQVNSADTIFDKLNEYQMMKKQFQKHLEELFLDNKEVIYIPAGRSLLATLSEQLQDYSLAEMDLTMQEFITLIRRTKNRFGSKIPEMIQEYTRTVVGCIDRSAVDKAYELMKRILKADYTSDSEGEKMYFDEHHWVKLMYSSSGQQEVLWILMLLFVLILQKKSAFVIIEEPEAHLFPVAQRYIVQFISLMVNSTSSSVLITTHSPYILTSANILLYSYQVEKDDRKAIVPKELRISSEIFEAYKVVSEGESGSQIESIFDSESALIDTDYIDEVSDTTNREFDKLIEVSVANDMQ